MEFLFPSNNLNFLDPPNPSNPDSLKEQLKFEHHGAYADQGVLGA